MFVPSLSWQNDRFYIEMAQKCRFSQDEIETLADQFPELEARLNRFTTIGRKRLHNKNVKRSELELMKVYAAKYKEMVERVRAHSKEQLAGFAFADDIVHVGQIPSDAPPHPNSMSEASVKRRFEEYGEVLTVVVRYRPATDQKPRNSWALVVFNGKETRLLRHFYAKGDHFTKTGSGQT
jgi:hypothetical protein